MADNLTVEQLYQNVLGRSPDPGGLAHWQATFGPTIDPNEVATFTQSAQAEKPGAVYTPSVTNEQIQSYLAANPGMTDTQIASAMNQYGVSPAQMAAATGLGSLDVQSRYNAAQAANQNYSNLITQAYKDIGRSTASTGVSGLTPAEINYWSGQLQSGALTPESFKSSFGSAVTGYMQQNPNDPYTQYVSNYLVGQGYKDVLGREAETAGKDYWQQQLLSGAISPLELKNKLAEASQGLDRIAAQKYLGKEIFAPEAFLKGTSGLSYRDVVDYINANIQDPVKIAQAAARYGVDPTEILQAKQAIGGQDIPTIKAIEDYLAQGRAGLGTRIQDIIASTIGTTDYLTNFEQNRLAIERNLGLAPDTLKSTYSVKDFSNKSIEDIEQAIQLSGANKYQEALNLSNLAKKFYGITDEQAKTLRTDLLKGNKVDETTKKFYNELITSGYSKDLETKILQDAAIRAPNSSYFKENPRALAIYSPIGEKKAVGENSNQYGIDPKTGLPFIHLGAIKNTMGDDVYVRPFREEKGQGELGYHPHSSWAGFIARGVGIFGAKAGQSDINYFDKIEKEIAKLGGIKTETAIDPDTGQKYTNDYVNVQETDPETGKKYTRKVNVESLFAQPEEDFKQTRTYKEYLDTQNALRTAAAKAGIPETKYTSTKQAYEDLNNRFKDLYVIQGRTDTLDPAAAKTLGIPDVKDNSKHATLLYQAVGDKLVPFTDPKTGLPQTVLKTFDFKDPNTTRGFFGDLANAAANILSVPPIAMALSAATGGISNLFSFATQPVVSTLVNAGVNELAANAITNAAVNSLLTEAMGGNAGDTFLSSLVSGAIGGTKGLPGLGEQFLNQIGFNNLGIADLVDPSTLGRFAGTYAGSALTGTDPTKMLINQAITQGIKSLPGMSRIGSPIQSSFEDLQSGGEGFKLSEAEKARLDAEVASLGNDQKLQGILGLPIKVEQDIITAVKELVPLLTAKGLTKQEATLLASNIIGAARSA